MSVQEPDSTPGNYYVSCVDGGRVGLLLGPFVDDHRAALSAVEAVREAAYAADPRSWFYSFGTVRVDTDRPGVLNGVLPHLLPGDLTT